MSTTQVGVNEEFLRAERAYLASEGVSAETQIIELKRLGSTARVLLAGDGPPVLLVPGVMTTGVVFADLVARLPDYRCIMVERPGTGLTPALPSPPTTLEAQRGMADDFLVDIMDGLSIERCHVVCTSMGGWATFRGAAAHPERFLSITALAFQIGARLDKLPWSMRAPLIKALIPRSIRANRALVRASLKSAGMKATVEAGKFSDEMLDYMVAAMRYTEMFRNETLCSPRVVTPSGPVVEARHSPELLAKVAAPVHLFWGTEDFFGGVNAAEEFASLLPNAELQMVAGAGHAVWMDEFELAVAAVREHLAS